MDLSELPEGEFVRHPWELARARFFLDQVGKLGPWPVGTRILDVGSGDAWFARQMLEKFPGVAITCWDVGYQERVPTAVPGIEFVAARPAGCFQLTTMLDVVEHVPSDAEFLSEVLSLAEPGSAVLFSVPAWPALYSDHDEALRHYRRYRPRDAQRLLEGVGLEVLRKGGLFHSLLLPRSLGVLRQKRARGETLTGRTFDPPDLAWRSGTLLHRAVMGALVIDQLVTRGASAVGVDLPGLSWWAACKKS